MLVVDREYVRCVLCLPLLERLVRRELGIVPHGDADGRSIPTDKSSG